MLHLLLSSSMLLLVPAKHFPNSAISTAQELCPTSSFHAGMQLSWRTLTVWTRSNPASWPENKNLLSATVQSMSADVAHSWWEPWQAHFLTCHPPFTFYSLKHWNAVLFFKDHHPILSYPFITYVKLPQNAPLSEKVISTDGSYQSSPSSSISKWDG